jgi:hypothetical protein
MSEVTSTVAAIAAPVAARVKIIAFFTGRTPLVGEEPKVGSQPHRSIYPTIQKIDRVRKGPV